MGPGRNLNKFDVDTTYTGEVYLLCSPPSAVHRIKASGNSLYKHYPGDDLIKQLVIKKYSLFCTNN